MSEDFPWGEALFQTGYWLSVVGAGGRLVVETPCEHGNDWLACDTEDCPAGSYEVVWPTGKEGG